MSTTMSSTFFQTVPLQPILFFYSLGIFSLFTISHTYSKTNKKQKNNNEHTKYTFWVLFTTITKAKEQCTILTVPLLGTKCLS